jgi:hypothetical protein
VFVAVILADRARAHELLGASERAAEDAREAIALLGQPGGAGYAAEAYAAISMVAAVHEAFIASLRPWRELRLERSGAERPRLARHPRFVRLAALVGRTLD